MSGTSEKPIDIWVYLPDEITVNGINHKSTKCASGVIALWLRRSLKAKMGDIRVDVLKEHGRCVQPDLGDVCVDVLNEHDRCVQPDQCWHIVISNFTAGTRKRFGDFMTDLGITQVDNGVETDELFPATNEEETSSG